MKAFVAITDNDWFAFLAARPHLEEVNFWTPSGKRLADLQIGQPVLFKLHSTRNERLNFIVGGGFFAHFSLLPVSMVWDTFGEKNGAASYSEMRARIEQYRGIHPNAKEDYQVGCEILEEPFFLPRERWFPPPADFSRHIQRGKGYDLSTDVGRDLWQRVLGELAVLKHRIQEGDAQSPYGEPRLVRPRLGQGAFRVLVTDAYGRRCAVTGEKALPALQAAHIRPVSAGGVHSPDNGLLLRADVHALYDRGYLTVTRNLEFKASRRLKDDFDNGEHYLAFSGSTIRVPPDEASQPAPDLLEWHADTVFKG